MKAFRMIQTVIVAVTLLGAVTHPRAGQNLPAVRLNVDKMQVMVHGYDVVSYFVNQRPEKGLESVEYRWQGAKWRFASAEHLALFRQTPERFAPQYGGFCAWAVSRGATADIDPEAWTIASDRLFLNYSKAVQKQWLVDRDGNIANGDANWPALSHAGH
jgi:hypothetical protein